MLQRNSDGRLVYVGELPVTILSDTSFPDCFLRYFRNVKLQEAMFDLSTPLPGRSTLVY